MRNNKGITLIALVVTIIVLLILAGVSIAMLTGDNGILSRGSQSSVATAIGNGKDAVALKVSELTANFYDKKYNGANVTPSIAANQELDAYITSNIDGMSTDGEYTVSATSSKITVTSAKDSTKTAECSIDDGVIGAWTNKY